MHPIGFGSNYAPEAIKLWQQGCQDHALMNQTLLDSSFERDKHGAARSSDCGAIAEWLTQVQVGTVILMRHIYTRDPLMPAPLVTKDGKYIGPVYALGVVTERIEPWCAEDQRISKQMKAFGGRGRVGGRGRDKYVKVSWQKMGLINKLTRKTRHYINTYQGVIRGTLNRMFRGTEDECKKFGKNFAKKIRRELLLKATLPIARAGEWAQHA
jgi:hypothetical protein